MRDVLFSIPKGQNCHDQNGQSSQGSQKSVYIFYPCGVDIEQGIIVLDVVVPMAIFKGSGRLKVVIGDPEFLIDNNDRKKILFEKEENVRVAHEIFCRKCGKFGSKSWWLVKILGVIDYRAS